MCFRISPLKREGRITQRQESFNLSAVEDIHTADRHESCCVTHTHTHAGSSYV